MYRKISFSFLLLFVFLYPSYGEVKSITTLISNDCKNESFDSKIITTGGHCNRPICIIEKSCMDQIQEIAFCAPNILKNSGILCPSYDDCAKSKIISITNPYKDKTNRNSSIDSSKVIRN